MACETAPRWVDYHRSTTLRHLLGLPYVDPTGSHTARSNSADASAATSSPDLGQLGDYMSARLSGRTAQESLEVCSKARQTAGDVQRSLSLAASWYQDQHPRPSDPAAAAALQELLDPLARLHALGARKDAVTPPLSPGRARATPPAAQCAAAMFLGPSMRSLTSQGQGRASTFDSVASATRAARPPMLLTTRGQTPPPGTVGTPGSRDHYAGAYSDPPADRGTGDATDANTRALQSIARSLSEREDATTQERGKVGSIGKAEERCVYYARACDNFHVALCSGVLGRTAFNALRNVASQGRSLMKNSSSP